jgi:hypothetical protein
MHFHISTNMCLQTEYLTNFHAPPDGDRLRFKHILGKKKWKEQFYNVSLCADLSYDLFLFRILRPIKISDFEEELCRWN